METHSPRVYCFVQTKDAGIRQRADHLGFSNPNAETGQDDPGRFLIAGHNARPVYLSLINDLQDWTLPDFSADSGPDPLAAESLLSCARLQGDVFGCCTDFWGLQQHYWHHAGDTFIASNNAFVVAHLLQAGLDDRSVDEYLFFLAPQAERTLFAGIKCLLPGQTLRYRRTSGRVELSSPVLPSETLLTGDSLLTGDNPAPEFPSQFLAFFEQVQTAVSPGRTVVGLSSGTDSTAVLAGLRHAGTDVSACTFGLPHYFEARRVARLSRDLGLDSHLVPLLTAAEWRQGLHRSSFWSSGQVNPLRLHYNKFYEAIPGGSALFEGTLGSQFVKGDFPLGSAVAEAHGHVLTGRGDVSDAVAVHLAALPEELRARIAGTVSAHHQSSLPSLRTPGGQRKFQTYALDNIVYHMFGGPLVLAADRLQLYLPYLSRGFLGHLFRADITGFRTRNSMVDRTSVPRVISAHAEIVGRADPVIDRWVLDKGISYHEARTWPHTGLKYLRAARLKYFRHWRYRDAFRGQIDNSVALNATRALAADSDVPWGAWTPDRAGDRLNMCVANLAVTGDILRSMRNGWQPWSDTKLDLPDTDGVALVASQAVGS